MEKNLKGLLIEELHDILSSEQQIVKALPEMVKASESPDLKKAFTDHLQETKGQVQRLEKIFKLLKIQKKEKFCKGTNGLIQECKEVVKDFKNKSATRDAALIAKAQRLEHYEISAYGTARTFASELDLNAVADLLQATLDEEGNADKKLTKLAEGGMFKKGINLLANSPYSVKPKAMVKKTSPSKKVSRPKPVPSKSKPKSASNLKSSASSKAKKPTPSKARMTAFGRNTLSASNKPKSATSSRSNPKAFGRSNPAASYTSRAAAFSLSKPASKNKSATSRKSSRAKSAKRASAARKPAFAFSHR